MDPVSINWLFIIPMIFLFIFITVILFAIKVLKPVDITFINVLYFIISVSMIINFTTIKKNDDKMLYIILLVIIINILNINHAVTGCKYPLSKKIYLSIRSAIIVLIIGAILKYSLNNRISDLLFTRKLDSDKGWPGFHELDVKSNIEKPDYCIDSDDEYYDEKVKKLTKEKRDSCNEYEKRKDISDKIYA